MLQSRDRIHRLGLTKDDQTNYYYFQSKPRVKNAKIIVASRNNGHFNIIDSNAFTYVEKNLDLNILNE